MTTVPSGAESARPFVPAEELESSVSAENAQFITQVSGSPCGGDGSYKVYVGKSHHAVGVKSFHAGGEPCASLAAASGALACRRFLAPCSRVAKQQCERTSKRSSRTA